MGKRYEVGTTGVEVDLIDGRDDDGDIWVDEDPEPGEFALAIGDPWSSAYAVVGTLDELEKWVGELADMVRERRAQAAGGASMVRLPGQPDTATVSYYHPGRRHGVTLRAGETVSLTAAAARQPRRVTQ